jgi:hypothetical protein
VLVLPSFVRMVRHRPKIAERSQTAAWLKDSLRFLAPPLAAFMLVVLAVNTANLAEYGVFRNNDFRSGPFPEAYGALARIRHDEWKRYVVFPRDARQRAYAASPAARELMPYFEGESMKRWIASSRSYPAPWGCRDDPAACNDEVLAGWFIWALRDAAAAAGHYRSALAADTFYASLADEINTACDRGVIPCHTPRTSLPAATYCKPWRLCAKGRSAYRPARLRWSKPGFFRLPSTAVSAVSAKTAKSRKA